MTTTVRVFDFNTKQMYSIPETELAPGMVKARVEGIDGEVWVDASQTTDGTLRHPPFGEDVRNVLRELQRVFAEVYPRSTEEWELGFRRDANPDKEIALWSRMADVYRHFTDGRGLGIMRKREIFNIILACANNGKNFARITAHAPTLSRTQVQSIFDRFFAS